MSVTLYFPLRFIYTNTGLAKPEIIHGVNCKCDSSDENGVKFGYQPLAMYQVGKEWGVGEAFKIMVRFYFFP